MGFSRPLIIIPSPPPSSRAHILHIGSVGAIGWEGNDQCSIILAYKYWSSVLVDKAY